MVDTKKLFDIFKKIESPLKRQLMMVVLITKLLEEEGKPPPIVIGGCALSYYSREVYFTADIDLTYADREGLNMAIEAPASVLA